MGKFNVGDKVRVRHTKVVTNLSLDGFIPEMNKYIGKEFTIEEECGDGVYALKGLEYFCAEDWLEPAKLETIVIYRNGDKTVALDKTTGKKAETICSKEDAYDFYTGAKIAFERLVDDDKVKGEPKLYNGKVVCLTSWNKSLTKGRIYEFKNGYAKYDDGTRLPTWNDAIESLEDLIKITGNEFIELVED